jgi:glycosyltransferase EpsF
MIKVLHVVGSMNLGGAEVMLMDIYRNISNDVHFDFLINYKIKTGIKEGDFDDEIIARGGGIKHIGSQWDLGFFNYVKAFKEIVKDLGQIDIVHIHMNAKSGLIAFAAKKAGVKHVIIHSHADLKFRGSPLSKFIKNIELVLQKELIARYANQFWGCSQKANESLFYKHLLTPEKSAIIKNAVDVSSYQNISLESVKQLRASYGIKENTIVFGNVGRVVRHKNVAFIIDILDKINKENIDFVFVFAGRDEQPDYLEEILKKAKQYNIENKVKHLGIREDIPIVMNSFDIFLGSALQEGFGLVAVEAQAAGLPCVLYTGFPKTVDMNLNLVTFLNNLDAKEWTKAIKLLPKKNNDFTLVKKAIISKGFDSESNTKEIERRYNLLMK